MSAGRRNASAKADPAPSEAISNPVKIILSFERRRYHGRGSLNIGPPMQRAYAARGATCSERSPHVARSKERATIVDCGRRTQVSSSTSCRLVDNIGLGLAQACRAPESGRERRESDHGVPIAISIDCDRDAGARKAIHFAQLTKDEVTDRHSGHRSKSRLEAAASAG